jgi:hypothetical protein
MSATATILDVWCLRQATGTDAGVNQALADIVDVVALDQIGESLADFVKGLPATIGAMDSARSDPDDLYLTTNTGGGLDNAIWPGGETTQSMQADQSAAPGISVPVNFSQNVSLWDHDSVSDDDLLGSVHILEEEQGRGNIARLAKSDIESSYYYVTYRVE